MFLLIAIFISRIPSLVGFIKTLKTDLKTFFYYNFFILLLKPVITIFGTVISVQGLNNLNLELILQRINISKASAIELEDHI